LHGERSGGVLVVFEWDHGVILLEPFNMIHKGIFAGCAFSSRLMPSHQTPYAAVQQIRLIKPP
jgi:hypothetical protein